MLKKLVRLPKAVSAVVMFTNFNWFSAVRKITLSHPLSDVEQRAVIAYYVLNFIRRFKG
jgi:hypothetical protein